MTTAAPSCTTLRAVRREERAGVVARLETWLDAPGRLRPTYPQVFGREAGAELLGAFDGDELLSHAAALDVLVRTAEGTVRATMVGSVATAPEHRGRGLASDLVRAVAARARAAGRDAVVLWSDQWAFYERLGFAPAGRQLEVALVSDGHASGEGIRPAGFGDLAAMLRLHHQKPCAAARGLRELAVLLSAAPMTTVVLERAGEVVAYACHGKGLDFGGWWHEVGGRDADAAALVAGAMAALGQEGATLMLPCYRRGMVDLLSNRVAAVREGASALGLPLTDRGRWPLFVDGLDSI